MKQHYHIYSIIHTCHTGQVRQYGCGALQQGADDDDCVKPVEEKYIEKVKEAKNVTDGSTTREIKVQVPASRCSLLPQWAVYGFSL